MPTSPVGISSRRATCRPKYSAPMSDAIRRISADIAGLDYTARAAMPCIGPQRADLVVGGVAILDAICRLWPVGRLRVADRGLREGILNLLIAADRAQGAAA